VKAPVTAHQCSQLKAPPRGSDLPLSQKVPNRNGEKTVKRPLSSTASTISAFAQETAAESEDKSDIISTSEMESQSEENSWKTNGRRKNGATAPPAQTISIGPSLKQFFTTQKINTLSLSRNSPPNC